MRNFQSVLFLRQVARYHNPSECPKPWPYRLSVPLVSAWLCRRLKWRRRCEVNSISPHFCLISISFSSCYSFCSLSLCHPPNTIKFDSFFAGSFLLKRFIHSICHSRYFQRQCLDDKMLRSSLGLPRSQFTLRPYFAARAAARLKRHLATDASKHSEPASAQSILQARSLSGTADAV
jgi:hypothetical protein